VSGVRREERFSVSGRIVDGVALLQVNGCLGFACLRDLRRAADGMLTRRPVAVVVDTRRVTEAPSAPAVLGLLRRYLARHGSPLVLAGPGDAVDGALHGAHVRHLYRIVPTPAVATSVTPWGPGR
jgi:hypothetical protein